MLIRHALAVALLTIAAGAAAPYDASAAILPLVPSTPAALFPIDRESDAALAKQELSRNLKTGASLPATSEPRFRNLMQSLPATKRGLYWTPEGLAKTHLQLLKGGNAKATSLDHLHFDRASALRNGAQIVQFSTRVQGIEVFRRSLRVLIDGEQNVRAVAGVWPASGGAAAKAQLEFRLDATQALAEALRPYGFDHAAVRSQARVETTPSPYRQLNVPASLTGARGKEQVHRARAKPVLFPLDERLIPAWYVETVVGDIDSTNADGFAHIIDANTGEVLFRHNQKQDAAFKWNVWAEPAPSLLPYPGPHGRGFVPHPTGFPSSLRPPAAATNLVTLQNVPFSQNDPWLPPAATVTTGNNTDAYADISNPDGFGGSDVRGPVFLSTNPATPAAYNLTLAPDASTAQREAAVRQMFYMVNWTHDWYYDAGFDETSGVAQIDNYGRGGIAADPILAEGQDNSGTDNANMLTPADGASPIMQMYTWSAGAEAKFTKNTPAPATDYGVGLPDWQTAAFNVTDDVVQALDVANVTGPTTTDGCTALTNGATVTGKIAFIDRGTCGFSVKAENAFNAGAVGVLIGNVASSTDPETAPGMAATGAFNGPKSSMPAQSLAFSDAEALRAALAGAVTGTMLRATVVAPDGTVDNGIIAHELGHYISNRLVEDSSGLTTNHSGGLGEGYGDFHGLLMTVKDEDLLVSSNPNFSGTYAMVGYPSFPGDNRAFYYGLRRYPYSIDPTKNPHTLRHIVQGEPNPTNPPPAFTFDNAEVHMAGEIWANMLWECYAGLLNDRPRLSFDEAQQRMKEYLIAGYKLTPPAPVLTEARDAILAVIAATDTDDFLACSTGFAQRGAGIDAVTPDRFGTTNAGTTENFSSSGRVTLSDPGDEDAASCDDDAVLDVGETGSILVPWNNRGWQILAGSTLQIGSDHAGLTFSGAASTTVNVPSTIPYQTLGVTIPAELASPPAGGIVTLSLIPADPAIAPAPGTTNAQIRLNYDEATNSSVIETFNTSLFPWNLRLTDGAGTTKNWQRRNLGNLQNVVYGPDAGSAGVGWIETPDILVGATAFSVALNHRFSFEDDGTHYDGGVVEISTNGGTTWSAITGTPTIYTGNLSNCCGNPLTGRAALTAANAGYPAFVNTSIDLGTTFSGQTVRLRFGVAEDAAVGAPGWDINTVTVTGATNLPFPSIQPQAQTCSANQAPVLSAQTAVNVAENTTAVQDADATDANGGDILTFSISGTDAALFTIAPATGVLAFAAAPDFEAPQDAGVNNVYDLTVQVCDNAAVPLCDSEVVAVTVTNTNDAPTFTSTAVTAATEDTAYDYAITTADPDGTASLVLSAPLAPTWLTFTLGANGTGTLSGTPTNAQVGLHNVTLRVTDGIAAPVEQTFQITVGNSNDAPTFTGEPYAFSVPEASSADTAVGTIAATDVDAGSSLVYAITAGNTGTAFKIDATSGAITVATAGAVTVANSPFTLSASVGDGNGGSDTSTVTITVIPVGPVDPLIFRNGFEGN